MVSIIAASVGAGQANLTSTQQELLGVMFRNGGLWPLKWHLRVFEHRQMIALVQRGLVVRDGREFRLVAS